MKPERWNKATSPTRPGKPLWAVWYGLQRWKDLRRAHLAAEPFCRMCAAAGIDVRATVVDHITPHRGEPVKFWKGPFQSLCGPHHNSTKQQAEKLGYSTEIGADGLPVDPKHPFNIGSIPSR